MRVAHSLAHCQTVYGLNMTIHINTKCGLQENDHPQPTSRCHVRARYVTLCAYDITDAVICAALLLLQLLKVQHPVSLILHTSNNVPIWYMKNRCITQMPVSGYTVEFHIVLCFYKPWRVLLIVGKGVTVHNDVKRHWNAAFLYAPRTSCWIACKLSKPGTDNSPNGLLLNIESIYTHSMQLREGP